MRFVARLLVIGGLTAGQTAACWAIGPMGFSDPPPLPAGASPSTAVQIPPDRVNRSSQNARSTGLLTVVNDVGRHRLENSDVPAAPRPTRPLLLNQSVRPRVAYIPNANGSVVDTEPSSMFGSDRVAPGAPHALMTVRFVGVMTYREYTDDDDDA